MKNVTIAMKNVTIAIVIKIKIEKCVRFDLRNERIVARELLAENC